MAEFYQGVNGAFSGKVGSVIGSNWRDIDYMRGLSKRTNKQASAKQLAVRARFTLLSQFLLLIKKAIERGYSQQYSGRATVFNLAVRANQGALKGTDLEPELDYSKIILSKGLTLPKPFGCKITDGIPGSVTVSWQVFGSAPAEQMDDKATIVLCCPEHQEAIVSMDQFVRRVGTADLEIPSNWSNTTVHAYVFMTAENGESSATAFAGSLPVF